MLHCHQQFGRPLAAFWHQRSARYSASSDRNTCTCYKTLLSRCVSLRLFVHVFVLLRPHDHDSRCEVIALTESAPQRGLSPVCHLADDVVKACFKTLMALLHTRHGSVRELSAVVLRQMTPNILGLADSAGAAASKSVSSSANPKHIMAIRSQALLFTQDVARYDCFSVAVNVTCSSDMSQILSSLLGCSQTTSTFAPKAKSGLA